MSRRREIRDPIHNFIPLDRDEVKVVSTKVFQRLRGIKQLAFAHLVYPGALHTRFEHSLGVRHIAGLLAKNLGVEGYDLRLVKTAALLHDIGHGPFSHVSESCLEIFSDKGALGEKARQSDEIHELITCDILKTNSELRQIIGESLLANAAELLTGDHYEPLLKDLVSGPLDADKQDYLLRDSYFCGVPYGVFDPHQLHRALCTFTQPSDDAEYLCISSAGVHAVEQFVMAKYYLTTQVYCHRVRLITDEMLTRAITLGIDLDGVEELRQLFSYDGTEGFVDEFTRWDDTRLLLTYTGQKYDGKYCQGLLRRLMERRLFKRVFYSDLKELPDTVDKILLMSIGKRENRQQRKKLEGELSEAIANVCGQEQKRDLTILKVYSIKSVREQSEEDEQKILVEREGSLQPFANVSPTFKSIKAGENEYYVEVYAPVEYRTRTERAQMLRKVKPAVMDVLASMSESEEGEDGNGTA